ncbi:hypothetical protein ACT009_00525 [Sphingomonas sp. Tas61C01]|uniref:hypothetical protein n=1 Tax=Sphingomonas sp. Tas61C01 TaxID=3458297 RepID=UPI00403E61C1
MPRAIVNYARNGSLILAALVLGLGASASMLAVQPDRAAPKASAPASGRPPMQIGVNVTGSIYYGSERIFANLAQGASAWKDPANAWKAVTADKLTAAGFPVTNGTLAINVPQPVWAGKDVAVVCTWAGRGTVRIDGDTRAGAFGHRLAFTWPGKKGSGRPNILIYLTGSDPRDPFRELDCREPGLVASGQFDQRYVDDMKPFRVLRFLDWSNTNGNPATVTWASRTTLDKSGNDGVAIEHMIDLANAAGSDPWFTVAYNADETYVRNMAKLVHDRLKPGRRAYFELSNEIWNFQFPVATQTLNEGVAEKLSTDKYSNGLMRYAEKTIWMQKLLTQAFADDPRRLVRVISSQNDNSWVGRTIMSFRDTPQWVDALATAPYFGHSFFKAPYDKSTVADLPALFERLEALRANSIAKALENKAVADKYGKRYITYEAGQHLIAPSGPLIPVMEAMQRSPLMGEAYDRFLADWKAQIGDTITLYSATGGVSQFGAWGMREYPGQPLAQAPKQRAVMAALAGR